eukprot:365596-Chlamydomonas_euryale.AAC.19
MFRTNLSPSALAVLLSLALRPSTGLRALSNTRTSVVAGPQPAAGVQWLRVLALASGGGDGRLSRVRTASVQHRYRAEAAARTALRGTGACQNRTQTTPRSERLRNALAVPMVVYAMVSVRLGRGRMHSSPADLAASTPTIVRSCAGLAGNLHGSQLVMRPDIPAQTSRLSRRDACAAAIGSGGRAVSTPIRPSLRLVFFESRQTPTELASTRYAVSCRQEQGT